MKQFLQYQLPLLLWAIMIFVLSSIPRLPEIEAPIGTDKLVHVMVYFLFCWLSYRAIKHQDKYKFLQSHAVLVALFMTVIYGYLDEVHQLYVEGRTYDLYDWGADALGAILFIALLSMHQKRKKCQNTVTNSSSV
ncbi:MAG: VanZ family protein [Bacteroidetes bacterium]|nr:VanZ family protein [Bacteroidota bacterium]